MTDKIVLCKLVTGDEIVGRQVEFNGSYITLKKIRALVVQPSQHGIQAGFMPWLFGATDEEMKIDINHIIGQPIENIDKGLEDAYLQQTSDIQFASSTAGLQTPGQ